MFQANRQSEIERATLVGDDVPARSSKTYQESKEAQECTYPGCGDPPADGVSECRKHNERSKARKAKHARTKRTVWAQKKRCTRCGRKRAPGSRSCAKCLLELGRLKTADVDKHVDKTRDHMERDGYARTRFHGQAKRGAPSTAALDAMDLRDGLKDFVRAVEFYEKGQSAEVQAMPVIQRDHVTDAWVSIIDRIGRVIDGIRDRHPETMKRIGVDENRRRGAEIARNRKRTRG